MNSLVTSVLADTCPYVTLSHVNYANIRSTMPSHVYSIRVVEVCVIDIHRIKVAPDVAVAVLPNSVKMGIHRRSPFLSHPWRSRLIAPKK